jgi:hypothetical protein
MRNAFRLFHLVGRYPELLQDAMQGTRLQVRLMSPYDRAPAGKRDLRVIFALRHLEIQTTLRSQPTQAPQKLGRSHRPNVGQFCPIIKGWAAAQ